MIDGFALVDKPPGWTSHDVVGRLRRVYGQRRVGHAGTLDPMATGVLIVGLGAATRLLRFVQGQPKTYEATIRLGAATTTDDADGQTVSEPGWELDRQALAAAMSSMTGPIEQVPSAVSAVKIDGERAYARVRRGEEVDLPARAVTIERFDVVGTPRQVGEMVDVDVVVDCSTGTYVRALARDLGTALGTAGHLAALRRTAIGRVTVDQCASLAEAMEQPPPVVAPAAVMNRILPVLQVDEAGLADLRHGRPIPVLADMTGLYAANDPGGALLAVVDAADGSAKVVVNLAGH